MPTSAKKPRPPIKAKVTHIMADGSVRDSIEGYVIPYNEKTVGIYEKLAQFATQMMREESERKQA